MAIKTRLKKLEKDNGLTNKIWTTVVINTWLEGHTKEKEEKLIAERIAETAKEKGLTVEELKKKNHELMLIRIN